jgi:WD40 repeat protein
VWDFNTGRVIHTLRGHSAAVCAVAISPDGRWAVSGSSDWTLKIWNLQAGCELRTLTGHSEEVKGVAVSMDGRWVVSASSDKTVKVWDLETGLSTATFTCDAAAECCGFVSTHEVIAGDDLGRVQFLSLQLEKLGSSSPFSFEITRAGQAAVP